LLCKLKKTTEKEAVKKKERNEKRREWGRD
jgi:hypothetical protein